MPTKFKKIAALALLTTIGLTACDSEVIAKPSDYDDPIVTIEGYEEEIYNNVLSIVYDSIHDGSLASDTLDKVLYQFAISVVGNYNTITSDVEGVTLKDAYLSAEGTDKTKANEFVKAHKAYWDEDRTADSSAAASETELARIVAKWNTIEERIAKKMHKDVVSGSYSDRNLFSEESYLYTLYSGMNKVANPATLSASELTLDTLVTPDIEDTEVFTKGILHREHYQDSINDEANAKNTYVEDEIIPSIYRELLIEQYILDETYNTLGRSYARKVNVVSIAVNSEYPLAANYLVNEFVETYINSNKEVGLDEFKILSNAWKGTTLSDAEYTLLEGAGLEGVDTDADSKYDYFLGTAYGDLMDDYSKITDDPLTNDATIESTFTNNNAYTKEIGLEIKTREIELKDHTENGWYIKNGGLSSLPETIRTRLFNIGVANEINDDLRDRKDNGYKKYADEDETNSYIARINGKSYLKVADTESSNTDKDMLFYDTASSTYYIIQIEEAASSSKLSKDSDNNYAAIYDDAEKMEEIVADVARVVAENESYKTLSTKHWLEKAELEYHDETVYDYFLENYPDLFE